jgi:hypothetical protein
MNQAVSTIYQQVTTKTVDKGGVRKVGFRESSQGRRIPQKKEAAPQERDAAS